MDRLAQLEWQSRSRDPALGETPGLEFQAGGTICRTRNHRVGIPSWRNDLQGQTSIQGQAPRRGVGIGKTAWAGEGKQEKWELGTSGHVILGKNQPKNREDGSRTGLGTGLLCPALMGCPKSSKISGREGVGMCSKGMSSKLSLQNIQNLFRTNMSGRQTEKTATREKPAPENSKCPPGLYFSVFLLI